MQIPYSRFTWNEGKFETQNFAIPSGYTLVDVLVWPTNGGAVMQGYVMNGWLRVVGWIPVNAISISSSYTFNCFLACSKNVR